MTEQTCQRAGCGKMAAFQIGLKIWAKGHMKAFTAPIELRLPLVVCEDHRRTLVIGDVLDEAGEASINAELRKQQRAPINPASAEFVWIEL